MATIRKWLTAEGFDWERGKILSTLQDGRYRLDEEKRYAKRIPTDHPILDLEFHDGLGRAECPSFVAKDSKKIYFPVKYDGATWCEYVYTNISEYLRTSEDLPYPGGG